LSLLAIASTGVLAGLNATTSSVPQTVAAGTLRLTMSATTGSAGFGSSISNLAPGDVVNRYVTLTNSGTLGSQGLTLTIASSGTPSLITDGTGLATNKALTVTVQSCSVAWTQATGLCGGVAGIPEIAATTLSSFATAKALATTSLVPNGGLNLRIQTALPDQLETTVDGNLPATTVQGGSANLTYTFFETQRTAASTNS
ncbi:MAG: CalY family protein, partial [Ilumatobacteraceae bacterium]|nr:CalY family protein [Ilumatobacteraceae bacterium]